MGQKNFIHDDFLLETRHARRLYHEFAAPMPILDYHTHLPARDIAEDRHWENLTQLWLASDHYKWRAMRTNGVSERSITGDATDWEKFAQWAATMPALLRNPLYHWSHLELYRYFGIRKRLGPTTARSIWRFANRQIQSPEFSARTLLKRSRVVLLCTTDDPADSLQWHEQLAADRTFTIRVLPAWRPDSARAIENPKHFNAWVDRLSRAADVHVHNYASFLEALEKRHAAFHAAGCRLSDHGLETAYAEDYTEREIHTIFRRTRDGRVPSPSEVAQFKSALLLELAYMDHRSNWTQQYHLGVLRNTNSRMARILGPNAGFDSIGDIPFAQSLAKLLDRLDRQNQLPRTILYNINPADNAVLATMTGNFQDGITPGKLQFGSAWWFLDQKRGIEEQLEVLSYMGLLSRFVGMLTDSRSFLSFTRHEYFRRILCNILGRDMAQGLIPTDWGLIGEMVRDICYRNAVRYFAFDSVSAPDGSPPRQKT